jgi:2'-5' RNA ligase
MKSAAPTGIKVITALWLPRDVWHINDIGQLRLDTDGLPPKTEAPHITLLDSFSSPDILVNVSEAMKEVAAQVEPFEIELKKINYFSHSKRGWTLYAEPEVQLQNNKNPLKELQNLLYTVVPKSDCKYLEFQYSPQKFLPHISLGKVASQDKLEQLKTKLSQTWQPIRFRVTEIYLLTKLVHDTTVRCVIPLGRIPEPSRGDFLAVPFPEGIYSINVNWIPAGSTDEDLSNLFGKVYKSVVEAKVIFKTIEKQSYTKGWGNVVFSNKADRDEALGRKWVLYSKTLEVFPCD